MNKLLVMCIGLIAILPASAQVSEINCTPMTQHNRAKVRSSINIPDIKGYKTLKADLHLHTMFSDGKVYPTVRVDEAWREGLDIIAITDHISYRPYKNYTNSDHNTSYEIAKPYAESMGITLIKATEITSSPKIGHYNALFIKDANPLDIKDPIEAVRVAAAQGAFIMWNHPGWNIDTCSIVEEYQGRLFAEKKIHGMEVYNSYEFYPMVTSWCADGDYAFMACTDAHNPLEYEYNYASGERFIRPLTLIFATDNSQKAIKEALFARRTVAMFDNNLAGKEIYLQELFNGSISAKKISSTAKNDNFLITNTSDVVYTLKIGDKTISVPRLSSVSFAAPLNTTKLEAEVINMLVYQYKHPVFQIAITK